MGSVGADPHPVALGATGLPLGGERVGVSENFRPQPNAYSTEAGAIKRPGARDQGLEDGAASPESRAARPRRGPDGDGDSGINKR